MKELIRSNDPVLLSYIDALLNEANIPHENADLHMSILDGSIGALPRRVLVDEEDIEAAREIDPRGRYRRCRNPMPGDVEAPASAWKPPRTPFSAASSTIAQAVHGSRAGLDAVFLAAACPAKAGEPVLDAGTGSGIVALAIARRVEGVHVTGVEIDADLCELARNNAVRNGLADRAAFHCGDVSAPLSRLFALGLAPDSFDHAVANPPFLEAARRGCRGRNAEPRPCVWRRASWKAGSECLAAFVKAARDGRRSIHRADALARLLGFLQGRFGGLAVYPLFPRDGAPASRILIQGRKGSRAPLRLMRGMVLHGAGNGFTAEAEPILRNGAGLELARAK